MKSLFVVLLPAIGASCIGQEPNKATGRILYEGGTRNFFYLEMLFNTSSYNFSLTQTPPGASTGKSLIEVKPPVNNEVSEGDRKVALEQLRSELPISVYYGTLASLKINFNGYVGNASEQYCVQDSILPVTWEILQDTLTIDGLPCQKAEGTRLGKKYTAWFAPSIPVSVAPLFFRGLPGLLIELKGITDPGTQYKMIELEWPLKKEYQIRPCSVLPDISYSDFLNKQTRLRSDALQYAEKLKKELEAKKKSQP